MAEAEKLTPFEFEPHLEYSINAMAERIVDLIETARDGGTDVLIFTDKSARPLSWVFMETWRRLYPKERRPEIRFLNVGSEKKPDDFPSSPTDEETRDYAARTVERFRIDGQLKKLYKGQGFEAGKNILVVEEQAATGFSYQVIKQGLEKAFPESNIQLFDAMLTSWNWGFVAEVAKAKKDPEEEKSDEYYREYGDATTGVIGDSPADIISRPYYTSDEEMLKRIDFGNIVEGRVWRPHQCLREDLKRVTDKTVELMRSGDRSWRKD